MTKPSLDMAVALVDPRRRVRPAEGQSLLADLGVFALKCRDLDILFNEACRLCAVCLDTSLSKVLEYMPGTTSRRVGEALYLGETVASVLRQWKGAIVLVAM